eukprot:9758946-Ditylum_brightwellii.AAC.1
MVLVDSDSKGSTGSLMQDDILYDEDELLVDFKHLHTTNNIEYSIKEMHTTKRRIISDSLSRINMRGSREPDKLIVCNAVSYSEKYELLKDVPIGGVAI